MFFKSKKAAADTKGADAPSTIIGEGTYLEAARMAGSEGVRIDGVYKGSVDIDSTLVLGDAGSITGDVRSAYFIVAGEMRGNIRCETQLHFASSSKVFGDVKTSSLVVDEGAQVKGRYVVGNARNNDAAAIGEATPVSGARIVDKS